MNALDLRADHPELLQGYAASPKQSTRMLSAVRRLVVPGARLKPVVER